MQQPHLEHITCNIRHVRTHGLADHTQPAAVATTLLLAGWGASAPEVTGGGPFACLAWLHASDASHRVSGSFKPLLRAWQDGLACLEAECVAHQYGGCCESASLVWGRLL